MMERSLPPFAPGKPPVGGPEGFHPPMADVSCIARKTLDIAYASESANQRLDLFYPDTDNAPYPTLLYLHGGGFAIGDKRDDHLTPYLKALQRGWAVAAIEYRLSGEAIFPAAVLDCRAAVRFLRENAERFELDTARFAAIGGSAGGNLSAMLGMNIPNGAFPGEGDAATFASQPFVAVAVDQFGPMNFKSMDGQAQKNGVSIADHDLPHSAESKYLGVAIGQASQALCDQANPLHYASDAMSPLLVQHGTADQMVPYEQSEELTKALKEQGLGERVTFVPIEGANHEDRLFFTDENMKQVLDFIAEGFAKKG